MVELKTFENALENAYLPVLSERLDNIDPFISSIAKTTSDVWGKQIIKVIHNYPFANEFLTLKADLVTISGNIELTDKAVRCCQGAAGAAVNLLNEEMEQLMNRLTYKISNALYNKDQKPSYLPEELDYEPLVINNLKDLFDDSQETLYGVDKKQFDFYGETRHLNQFNLKEIRAAIDELDEVNFILCNAKTKRLFQDELEKLNSTINIRDFNDGYHCLMLDNLYPILTNRSIEDNTIYLVNSNDFKIHQLCDWQWIKDENSNILKLIQTKPVYNATLVKYANLICEKPHNQMKIIFGE